MCLPEDDLGNKIEQAAKDHGALVTDFVRYNTPREFQQQTQSKANAFDDSDLRKGDSLRLSVQGRNRGINTIACKNPNRSIKTIFFFIIRKTVLHLNLISQISRADRTAMSGISNRLMQTVLHQEYQLSVRMDKFIILPVFLICNSMKHF